MIGFFYIFRNKEKLGSKKLDEKVGTLYEEIDITRNSSLIYHLIFLAHRMIYGCAFIIF